MLRKEVKMLSIDKKSNFFGILNIEYLCFYKIYCKPNCKNMFKRSNSIHAHQKSNILHVAKNNHEENQGKIDNT